MKAVKLLKVLLALSVLFFASQAFSQGKKCGKSQKHGFSDKFFKKTHMIIQNSEELGLSEKEVKKIKALKLEVKKKYIKKQAEIDVIDLDIKSKFHVDKIDVDDINKLIDEKYKIKKTKAKSFVQAFADLKEILSKEQCTKLKSILKKTKCHKCMMAKK